MVPRMLSQQHLSQQQQATQQHASSADGQRLLGGRQQMAAEAEAAADGFRAIRGGLAGGVPPELAAGGRCGASSSGWVFVQPVMLHCRSLGCSTALEPVVQLQSELVSVVASTRQAGT